MIVKLIISTLIVGCSTLIGVIYAKSYTERTKLLNNIIGTLQMLESEIVYSATPLPLLLKKISKRSKSEIAKIFSKTVEILEKKDGQTFSDAWQLAIKEETKHSVLKKEDIELLIQLGNSLGISDIDDQVKHIRLAMEEIKRSYEQSIVEQNKNVQLYKNLGFLFGISVVIILF
ncbi:stage III sporulation protein SpoIIIAB [Serpentinicella alkaliphila]|uniref:Stage III sporulation protein AB n=1 Tax=Serpentinicella alkaliphila TaxID=1734049 RepID=A0A4R2TKG6_9FIRM|nr:stage III sporulation protein SpoIIIAB [Serpentinicella alkaliphila]QUH26648.1 stage III sporulation protein AB [Serpentinicella alkaliphila]TCQ02882.1 stage III sporulation protein AB [Serpentinicella alkaliphila]